MISILVAKKILFLTLKYQILKTVKLLNLCCSYDIKKGASLISTYEAAGYWNGSVYGWQIDDLGDSIYTKMFLFEEICNYYRV